MEMEMVPSKSEQTAALLYKTMIGAATLGDRMKVQALVVTCDGPTYEEALFLAQEMRLRDVRPVLMLGAPAERFAA